MKMNFFYWQQICGVAVVLMLGCHTAKNVKSDTDIKNETSGRRDDTKAQTAYYLTDAEADGLLVGLRESSPANTDAAAPVKKSTPMEPGRVRQLLARTGEINMLKGEQKSFAMRQATRPPPKTGELIDGKWGEEKKGPTQDNLKKLTVVRYAPEGEVALAKQISITFSKPMVAVSKTTVTQKMPVEMTPETPGEWEWLGTQTLLFRPKNRLPMGTGFEVVVPADTRAADGTEIDRETRFKFETPALKLEAHYPVGEGNRLDEPILLLFNQEVAPRTLLPSISVYAGSRKLQVSLASDAAIKKFKEQNSYYFNGENEKKKVIVTTEPLPQNTKIRVVVKAGAKSAEGPRVTDSDIIADFKTYGPFRLEEVTCGYNGGCRPDQGVTLKFNNPIDESKFRDEWIQVTPAIPDMTLEVSGGTVWVQGLKTGKTKYTFAISKKMRDIFGQDLSGKSEVPLVTDEMNPTLIGPREKMITLSPYAEKRLPIQVMNHKAVMVKVNRVTPADVPAWFNWAEKINWNEAEAGAMPGKTVFEETLKFDADDQWEKFYVDFKPWLKNGAGQFAVEVKPLKESENSWQRQAVRTWVQLTGLGASTFADGVQLVVFANDLKTGRAKESAKITLWSDPQKTEATDTAGMAIFKLSASATNYLTVEKDGDTLIHLSDTPDRMTNGSGWQLGRLEDTLEVFAQTDRGMYKPGETVNIKGWIRQHDAKRAEALSRNVRTVSEITWQLSIPGENGVKRGKTIPTDKGGFYIAVKIPKNANLGRAEISLETDAPGAVFPNRYRYISFDIQEFRKPEFEVNASVSDGPHFLGETATATVTAKYYTGESLRGAPVTWQVNTTEAMYTPPNQSEFHFGVYRPWWGYWYGNHDAMQSGWSMSGMTGGDGSHQMDMHFESMMNRQPANVHLTVTATDVNRQQWSTSTSLLVHPSKRYVGVRLNKNFVDPKEEIDLDVVVTDVDGNRTENDKVLVKLIHLDNVFRDGKRTAVEREVGECGFTSAKAVHSCVFKPDKPGMYQIVASTADKQGRPAKTDMRLWVSGDAGLNFDKNESDKVVLIPGKDTYEPNEKATLLIKSPIVPAEGYVSVRKAGVRYQQKINITKAQQSVTIPLTQDEIPSVVVQVDVSGKSGGTKDGKQTKAVAHASGQITLKISPYKKRLHVTVLPKQKKLKPADTTQIELTVTDVEGKPVKSAEVALWMVDEAILALSDFKLGDPVDTFYRPSAPGVTDSHSRSLVRVPTEKIDASEYSQVLMKELRESMPLPSAAPLEMTARSRAMPKRAAGAATNGGEKIYVRKNFDVLAYYEPALVTDENGHIKVSFTIPDTLTRYRIMAIAADDQNRFGNGEAAQVARLPLMVRPSAPRFLNFGDRFEFPVVVQNTSNAPQTVEVAITGTNVAFGESLQSLEISAKGSHIPGQAGKKIDVPAGASAEVRFAAVAQTPGTAGFVIAASSQNSSDSATVNIPIWTPATTEAFATYGSVTDGNVYQKVKAPDEAWKQFGGLTVTTSSTGLQALTDAFIYLVDYPYECSEQLASKIIAIATLKDVLKAFDVSDMPSDEELKRVMGEALKRLEARQNWNGEFGMWRKESVSYPWISVHVANAMIIAKEKGYPVNETVLQRSGSFLQRIEQYIDNNYSRKSQNAIVAYALYVRHRMGENVTANATKLQDREKSDDVSMEARGWLLQCVAKDAAHKAKLLRHAINNVSETAKDAHFVTEYTDGAYALMHSSRRVDGVWLNALLDVDKENPLIEKLMQGLLAHRKQGRWESTQENAFVLIALDNYFRTWEKTTPDFVSRVWLGNRVSEDQLYRGRTTQSTLLEVPMNEVPTAEKNLIIEKSGSGRLYYRIGMNYAPQNLNLMPLDRGFTVTRQYESVENPEDVWKDDDGVWHVKAGARVKVTIQMVASGRRYHVALVDPLPAGFEAVNTALAVDANRSSMTSSAVMTKSYWWWSWPWYEHQNMRDERVEAFTSLLWDGVYSYTYEAKATTPGIFTAPPAKAHEMYSPETFGRSGTDKVIVD
ncbi:MAG: Ig-like domain-containing protein [Deltaproteobacteria bacterium]|nr:Ig-like domain-containing protein [Deltaproteobacteria bacterium]